MRRPPVEKHREAHSIIAVPKKREGCLFIDSFGLVPKFMVVSCEWFTEIL